MHISMSERPTARFWHAFDKSNGGDGSLIKDLGIGAPRAKRTNAAPEQQVLNSVLLLCRTHPAVAWAARINSGAYKTPDGRFIRFGFVGCSDIIGQMRDGSFLALEVKSQSGAITEDQQAFIDRVRKNGGCAGLVRSVDDAIATIKGYLSC